jgi:hypothetical protein
LVRRVPSHVGLAKAHGQYALKNLAYDLCGPLRLLRPLHNKGENNQLIQIQGYMPLIEA